MVCVCVGGGGGGSVVGGGGGGGCISFSTTLPLCCVHSASVMTRHSVSRSNGTTSARAIYSQSSRAV